MVYLVVYLWVIDAQEGAIAGWYVVLIVLAALSFALAALDRLARPALTVGLVTSALAMLVGLLSLGAQWHRLSSRHSSHSSFHAQAQTHLRQQTNRNRVSKEGSPADHFHLRTSA